MALNVGELYASFGIDSKGLDSQISGIEKKCQSIGSSLTKTGAVMSAAVTAPVLAMGKSIYKAGTDFQAQMSRVSAIAGLDKDILADAQAIEQLTAAALEMGSTTSFTASEAGEALEYMAMAGWDTESMLAGLKPIMDLAAASGESLGTTSDIVTDAMTAFGYTLENAGGDTEEFNRQITHFSDVLAATATNANTNVAMLGESFKYVAPLAGTLGYSIDDISVALGLMANNGIKGSQAGTSLRNVFQNLIKPTDAQEAAMKKLGLSLTDSNGKVKDFSELMGDMRKAAKESGVDMQKIQKEVSKLDEQLEKGEITEKEYNKAVQKLSKGSGDFLKNVTELAGTRGLSAMLAIMNASDEEFDKMTEAILHCDGATAKMAKTMLDNTKGKVTLFQSALEGLEITLWTHIAPAFDAVVEKATEWVEAFRKASPEIQKSVLKLAGLAAVAGPAMLVMGRIVTIVGKLAPALAALVSPMGIVSVGLGLMAIAAVDAHNDIGKALQKMSKSARRHLAKFNKTILDSFDKISGRIPAIATSISNIFRDDLPTAIDTAMLSIQGMVTVLGENADEILNVGVSLIEGISTGVSRNLPQLIPVGIEMLASMTGAIIKAVPTLVKAVVNVGAAVVKGLLDTDWTEAGTTIINAISTAVSDASATAEGIVDSIVSLINTYFTPEKIIAGLTNATSIAEGFFTAITNAFTTIGDTGVNIVDKIVGAIVSMIDGMSGAEFFGKLDGLAKSIINGIITSLVSLGTAGGKILTSIINGIATILGKITESDFASNMGGVAESIMTAIGNGIGAIDVAAGDIKSKLVTAISGLLEKINVSDFVSGFTKVATTLIEGLGRAIGTSFRNSGEIIKGIATALSTALANGNISGMLGNLASLGAAVITAIGEAIKSAAGGAASLISAVGELISTALSKGANGESLVGDLSSFGSTIINAIVQALGDAADAAGQIITALSDLISDIDWGEVGADLTGFVSNLVSGLVSAVQSEDFSGVVTAIGTAIGGLAGSLVDAAGTLVASLITFMLDPAQWAKLGEGIIALVEAALKGAWAAIEKLNEKLIELNPEVELSTENLPDMSEYLQTTFFQNNNDEWVETIDVGLAINWMQRDNFDLDTQELIAQFFEGKGYGTYEITDGVLSWNPNVNLSENVDLASLAEELNAYIQEHMQESEAEPEVEVTPQFTTEGAEGEGLDMESLMRESLGEHGIEVETSASVTAEVTEVEVGSGTDIQSEAQAAVDTALSAISLTAAVDVATSVTVNVSDSNADTIGTQLGEGLGHGVASGIASQNSAVVSAAGSLLNSAGSALRSSNVAENAGIMFGAGFARGISSQISAVRQAAQALANAANVTLPKTIDAHSPSKIALKYGNFFGEGFAFGIGEKIKLVKRETSAMAKTAINALSMNPARGLFGMSEQQDAIARRNSVDYNRLAAALAAMPSPVLQLDGKTVAEVNANNTANAQNARTKTIAMRYGSM